MARAGVAAVLLSVVAATACTGDASTPPVPEISGSQAVEGLAFGDCGDLVDLAPVPLPAERAEHLTFECGVLVVPLDHDSPGGEHLGIQVVRIRDDRQTDRIGTLVLGAGGPGQSGIALAPSWASSLSDEVLRRFDVVTLDPRGVGTSGGFNCPSIPQDDEPSVVADVLTPAGWAFAVEVSSAAAASCLGELGDDRAGRFGTIAAAQDLDLLREAVGDDALTFVGFSYGAKLGAEYARQFPDHVRALVLDGPSHPGVGWIENIERQVAGYEEALRAWADNCPERPTCDRLGQDPRATLDGLFERARQMPIPSGRPQGDPPAGEGDIISALVSLLRYQRSWPFLDDALAEAALGDSGSLREAIEQGVGVVDDSEEFDESDANLVINCTDARRGPTKAAILRSARRLASTLPVFGKAGGWWLVGCKYWTGVRHVLPVPEATGAPAIVVVGTRHDPATPYAGAVAMARILGSGHLLTWEGYTHTAYGQTECVTEAVDAYLVDLVVPDEGATCPA